MTLSVADAQAAQIQAQAAYDASMKSYAANLQTLNHQIEIATGSALDTLLAQKRALGLSHNAAIRDLSAALDTANDNLYSAKAQAAEDAKSKAPVTVPSSGSGSGGGSSTTISTPTPSTKTTAPTDTYVPSTSTVADSHNWNDMATQVADEAHTSAFLVPSSTDTTIKKSQTITPEELTDIQNQSLLSLLKDDNYYDPNVLSALRNPTYRFKLFMVPEHELITADIGQGGTTSTLYDALDSLPKIIIAQSGVTAGFNITNVEMTQTASADSQDGTQSTFSCEFRITVTEAMGSSLLEAMSIAATTLGVQNFAKYYMMLELNFIGYSEDGSISLNPCSDFSNGGRWVYPIKMGNMAVHLDEQGATYNMTAVPFSLTAFSPDSVGSAPDTISVTGGTIGEFCDDLATKLQAAWKERYAGEIVKFKFKFNTLDDGTDLTALKLKQSDFDPISNIQFSGDKTKAPSAIIPMGTTIGQIITSLFANCAEMQPLMLDTTQAINLEDEGGTFRGKKYRVAMVPQLDPDISLFGYDPITGQYMQDILFVVNPYRVINNNLSPSQTQNTLNSEDTAKEIVKRLREQNYLKKKYEYRFTGKNTEVLHYDLDFNFAFINVMPEISGWRNTIDASVDHEKYNEALDRGGDGGSYSNETNEIALDKNINSNLNDLSSQIVEKQKALTTTTDPAAKTELQTSIADLKKRRSAFQEEATRIRTNYNQQAKDDLATLEASMGNKSIYAEDQADPYARALPQTYVQTSNNGDSNLSGGFSRQWHRGQSLVGALLNQVYNPLVSNDNMGKLTLEIRGDPYWLGYSSLEKRNYIRKTPVSDYPLKSGLPNFTSGENSFAVIVKFPYTVDDNGVPVFRETDIMNGLYTVAEIKSTFDNGEFKQTLTGVKLTQVQPTRDLTNGDTLYPVESKKTT